MRGRPTAVGRAAAKTPSSTATSRPTDAIGGEATGAGCDDLPRDRAGDRTRPRYADEEFCYLTTTGRRTGQPHTIEIWFAVDRGVVYMMAGGRDRVGLGAQPHRATPRCGSRSVSTTGTRGHGSWIPGTEEDARVRPLLRDKYASSSDDLVSWARTALPVALEIVGPASDG